MAEQPPSKIITIMENQKITKKVIALLVMMGFKKQEERKLHYHDYVCDKWFIRIDFLTLKIDMQFEDTPYSSDSIVIGECEKPEYTIRRIINTMDHIEEHEFGYGHATAGKP